MVLQRRILAVGLALLTLVVAIFLGSMQSSHSVSINELYVFGDSLSDMGAVFRETGGTYPPNPTYFQGRYSNGRVWVEYLADRLQLSAQQTKNFAYGGATTGSDRSNFVPGLLSQVQSFTQTHKKTSETALYVLWAGANDYLQGTSNVAVPVEHVTGAISSLANVGAKKFLVANLPDLGQLPATRGNGSAASLSALTQAHNQNLRRALKVLNQQRSDLQVVMLDANKLYREAITNPAAFGFTNVTGACLSNTGACSNPNQYLFWDGIHPTTAAHRILGEAAFTVIQDEGVINTRAMLLP